MKLRPFLVSFLAVSLAGTGCTSNTPGAAVAPSDAVLDPRLIGTWRLVDAEDESHARVAAFDDHQLLVEWVTPVGCGYDCTVEPCQMHCPEDPVFGTVSISLARLLVAEVAGVQWVSIGPIWIGGQEDLSGPVPEEDRWWMHGRLSFLPGDTLLLELLADNAEGAEEATSPEAVQALLTEENLSSGESERYRFVPVPPGSESVSPPADP